MSEQVNVERPVSQLAVWGCVASLLLAPVGVVLCSLGLRDILAKRRRGLPFAVVGLVMGLFGTLVLIGGLLYYNQLGTSSEPAHSSAVTTTSNRDGYLKAVREQVPELASREDAAMIAAGANVCLSPDDTTATSIAAQQLGVQSQVAAKVVVAARSSLCAK